MFRCFIILIALTAVLGVLVALLLSSFVENMTVFLVPFAAGGFIYVAGSDLIPELHKGEVKLGRSFFQLVTFVLGIMIMLGLVFIEF